MRRANSFLGFILLPLGGLLSLNSLGILNIYIWGHFLPLLPIFIGAGILWNFNSKQGKFSGNYITCACGIHYLRRNRLSQTLDYETANHRSEIRLDIGLGPVIV